MPACSFKIGFHFYSKQRKEEEVLHAVVVWTAACRLKSQIILNHYISFPASEPSSPSGGSELFVKDTWMWNYLLNHRASLTNTQDVNMTMDCFKENSPCSDPPMPFSTALRPVLSIRACTSALVRADSTNTSSLPTSILTDFTPADTLTVMEMIQTQIHKSIENMLPLSNLSRRQFWFLQIPFA